MKKKTPFSRLSKTAQRVKVLKDALKWIRTKQLLPTKNIVVDSKFIDNEFNKVEYSPGYEATQAQPVVLEMFKNKKSCKVCARGALLISTIASDNEFPLCDLVDAGSTFSENSAEDKRLMKLFSAKTIRQMEIAFEGNLVHWNVPQAEYKSCISFFKKYKKSTPRLEAILKNAIRNKGIFKP